MPWAARPAKNHPFRAQIAGERRQNLGLARRQDRHDVDDRHDDAGPREQLAEFAADVAAADHQQRSRQPVELESRRARQIGHALDARDRRQRRGSAGGDDDLVGPEHTAVDGDTAIRQPAAAFEITDGIISRQQVDILCPPQRGDQRILAALDRPPVLHAGLCPDPAKTRGGYGVMQLFRRPDQVLRRHAAGVDAGATDRPVPDQRDAADPAPMIARS